MRMIQTILYPGRIHRIFTLRHWSAMSFILLVLGILVLSFFFFSVFDVGHVQFQRMGVFHSAIQNGMERCFSVSPWGAQAQCMRQRVATWFQSYGVASVRSAFDERVKDVGESSVCHNLSHVLGEELYALTKDVGAAVAQCTTACHFGCMHGAVGALVRDRQMSGGGTPDETIERLPAVALCAENNQSRSAGEFQLCLHGFGHTFMVYRKGDIFAALADCDRLELGNPLYENQCWSGVFMENVSNLMGGGHTYIKADDPLYACTMPEMPQKYLRACYVQLPMRASSSTCMRAPEEWRAVCNEGIGLGLAARHTDKLRLIVEGCRDGDADFTAACLRGAFFYLALDTERGPVADDPRIQNFCSLLTPRESSVCDTLEEL